MPIQKSYLTKGLFLWVIFFLSIAFCKGQCDEIKNIIDSEVEHSTKLKQLQSFMRRSENSLGNKEVLSDCYHDYANKWFFERWLLTNQQNNLDSAIYYTKKAVEGKIELKLQDENSLKKSTYNLAFFHFSNQDFFEAIDNYLSVLELGEIDRKTQFATIDLALCYETIGDFEKARQHYLSIIRFCSSQNNSNKRVLNTAYLGLINLYNRMEQENLNSETKDILVSSDSVFRMQGILKGFQLGQYYVGRGNYFFNMGEFDKAKASYLRTLQVEAGFNNFQNAIIYNNLGLCELERGNLKNSEENALTAIEFNTTFSGPYETLGDLYLEKKEFARGVKYYQQAINLVMGKVPPIASSKLPTSEELELTAEKPRLLNHLTKVANGWLRFYENDRNREHLRNALKTFTHADQLVDIIRSESTEFQSELYWREQSNTLYMKAIKVCLLLNMTTEAYYFMERNKALLLLEDLTNEDAKQITKMPNAKAQQEYDLKRAIFLSENDLQENAGHLSNDSLTSLKQTVLNHKYNYEKFIDSLEITYPDYAKFKKKVDVLTFENLKANYIAQNKATLHYILNDEDGYGLLTTADTTELFRLDSIPNLNGDVEQLIAALSNGLSDMANFKNISNRVFKSLFPKNVYNKIKGKQLTIIPDYTLQQIPFETLVVDNNELNYLFQDVEIAYAYSVSLLDHTQKGHKEFNTDFLGVAPILFDSLQLSELYFSENEVRSIAGIFSGETLLSGQASKKNFIDHANTHSILHLATHADIGDGDNPWIAFNDSKMYLKEIYATKNAADMVVLSACNTSSGELKRGEGVMSLARGFFYSGAKSVVSTLWPVADESGKDILIDFYKNLDQGLTKSKALQQAKHDYLKNTEEEELKHPYYWAGFVVLGDNAPLSDKPISPWLLLVSGILGAAIIVFGYKKIKAHQAAA